MSQPPAPMPLLWPFPTWNGSRWVMPIEQLTPAERKEFLRSEKNSSRTPDLSDIEDARF